VGCRAVAGTVLASLLAGGPAAGVEPDGLAPQVQVALEPAAATVGDHLALRIAVSLPAGTQFEPPQLGPTLGPFAVVDGRWSAPASGPRTGWSWSGTLVAFRTGQLELPGIRIALRDEAGTEHATLSDPVPIEIRSVLGGDETATEEADIADLKPPASIAPDYRPLLMALGALGLLLLGAALLWWLHRRYSARLGAVPAPDDPFHRTPPHEWVYAELQRLLDRRLAEHGQVELFFAELSRILKLYLGGRYRVELLERTTAEVPEQLGQAGAAREQVEAVAELLRGCDLVKFAGRVPEPAACRATIESAYQIVDATKPRAAGTEQGAA